VADMWILELLLPATRLLLILVRFWKGKGAKYDYFKIIYF